MMSSSRPDLAGVVTRARASGDFSAVVEAVPYFRFLGLKVREHTDGLIVILPDDERHIGRAQPRSVHGGVTAALLEATALIQLLATDTVHVAKTITMTTDFFRTAYPGEVTARARITRQGRRIANVRVEAWQDDPERPVAVAHGQFLLSQPQDTR
jgi:uncharacterized protein (TIGR00369 family)